MRVMHSTRQQKPSACLAARHSVCITVSPETEGGPAPRHSCQQLRHHPCAAAALPRCVCRPQVLCPPCIHSGSLPRWLPRPVGRSGHHPAGSAVCRRRNRRCILACCTGKLLDMYTCGLLRRLRWMHHDLLTLPPIGQLSFTAQEFQSWQSFKGSVMCTVSLVEVQLVDPSADLLQC